MCRYCIEYDALCQLAAACQDGVLPDEVPSLYVDAILSFHAMAPSETGSMTEAVFDRTTIMWQQAAAFQMALMHGDCRLLGKLDKIALPGWHPRFDVPLDPTLVRQSLEEWYRQQGVALLDGWPSACQQDDDAWLFALLVCVALWHSHEMSEAEWRYALAMAAYAPAPGEPAPSMALWLRRECRLLLWDKGRKDDVAQWDAKEDYAITLRSLMYLRHDSDASAMMQQWAPAHWQLEQQA